MNKLGTPQLAGNFPLFSPTSPANNCVIGKLGGIDHAIGQAKLSWRPNDKFDVLLTVRQREENDEETPELALAYQPNGTPNSNDVVEVYNKAVRETYGLQLDSRFLPPASDPQATYATNCRPNLPLSGTYPAVDGVYVPSGFCYPQGKTASHTLMSGSGALRICQRCADDRDRRLHQIRQRVHGGWRSIAAGLQRFRISKTARVNCPASFASTVKPSATS